MPVAFPPALRTCIRANKARRQPAAFAMHEPRRGPGYAEANGTASPVIWDMAFRFTTAEAAVFRAWFNDDIARGTLEFTLPIRTEYGLITHTCLFLADSLLPTRENGEVWEYSARVLARALLVA